MDADREGRYLGRVSVNASGGELEHPDYVATLGRILAETGLAPERLVLEVTESSLAADTGAAVATLTAIRALGVRVAIDDFGTGYSSLSRLEHLPLDILKIDKALIRNVGTGTPTPMIATILALSSALHLAVIAEGVETSQQVNELLAQGCVRGQGWLFGRPQPMSELRLPSPPSVPAPRRAPTEPSSLSDSRPR
jgi:EAL domain-containing protein (putative c-di-GMP-specific phosphodiesterase class I)